MNLPRSRDAKRKRKSQVHHRDPCIGMFIPITWMYAMKSVSVKEKHNHKENPRYLLP